MALPPPPPGPALFERGCGHSHNDYEQPRPLEDALEAGLCSVEVDVFLVDDALLVAHDLVDTDPSRTLEGLYLDPLQARHEAGTLPEGPPLLLLVDVKSEASPTYAALHERLTNYASMLTSFEDGVATPGAVTVVVSGARDRAALEAQSLRYAALDGRLADLGAGVPVSLMPLVSQSFGFVSLWQGEGELPPNDVDLLRGYADQAHAEGRALRFWAIPDTPNAWRQLRDVGVDLINTDDPSGYQAFDGGT